MRLHRILFYLLLAFLPVQLGRHFWPDFAFVSGIRVDYLAPTVYLTDLLVIGILLSWGIEKSKIKNQKLKTHIKNKKYLFFLLSIFLFLSINAFLAQNSGAAFYKLVKIIEFALLGFYIAKNNYMLYAIRYTLPLVISFSSLIALTQFIKQSSLNGIFWFLGERTFNLSTPGIARAVWGGQLILRPYATFPHPNVLAGFLLISLILTVPYFLQKRKVLVIGYLLLVISAIACSFSRTAWLVGLLICFWLVIRYLRTIKLDKKILLFVACCLLFVAGVLSFCALNLSTEEAVVQRLDLAQAAILMIKQNPVIGVGLNNFIPRLLDFWPKLTTTRFLQPVHNIFLLVLAETGIIGLLIFIWFLILTFKRVFRLYAIRYTLLRSNKLCLYASLTAILLLGLFDHYFLTLQQTQLLFTIVLGLAWGTKKAKIKL